MHRSIAFAPCMRRRSDPCGGEKRAGLNEMPLIKTTAAKLSTATAIACYLRTLPCGDSGRDTATHHFSIMLPSASNPVSVYQCSYDNLSHT